MGGRERDKLGIPPGARGFAEWLTLSAPRPKCSLDTWAARRPPGTILAEAWRIMIFGPQGMWEEWEHYTYW